MFRRYCAIIVAFPPSMKQNKNTIKQALEKIGPERILFGSDTPIAEMGDKEKYGKFADFVEDTVKEFYKDKPEDAEKALNNIFYDNAEEVFINKKWYQSSLKKEVKKASSSKKGLLIAAGVAAAGIIAIAVKTLCDDAKKVKAAENSPSKVVKH